MPTVTIEPPPPRIDDGMRVNRAPPQKVQAAQEAEAESAQAEKAAQAELKQKLGVPSDSLVRFEIDSVTGHTIVKVLDATTKEVLRQLPGEEVYEAARTLATLRGTLVDLKV